MQRSVIDDNITTSGADNEIDRNDFIPMNSQLNLKNEVTPGANNTKGSLVQRRKKKIHTLYEEALNCDDADELQENQKKIDHYENLYCCLTKTGKYSAIHNQNSIQNDNQNNNQNDASVTTIDNRTAYQNAEAFISAFELTFQVNDVDVNKEWKKYLTISFLYRKNTKHMRWYQNHFEPLDAITSWNEIKQAIADRS
ncbi:hypothetical protein A0J61_11498, partial [Choanephora cucurbitarum]